VERALIVPGDDLGLGDSSVAQGLVIQDHQIRVKFVIDGIYAV
jgi:hypothetical protein